MKLTVAQKFVKTLEIGVTPAAIRNHLSGISSADWDAALSWLRRSGLALYWWTKISTHNLEDAVPKRICQNLCGDFQQNHERLSAMEAELRSIVSLLQDAGIPYAVLKGFALVPEYCPDADLRSQYDFDFLVHSDSLRRLEDTLCGAGFTTKPQRPGRESAVYFYPQRRPTLPKSLDSVFSPDLYRPIEIHTCLWHPHTEKISFALPGDFLSRVIPKQFGGLTFFSLAPEDAMVFQVLHTLHHILNNQCRLSHFLELAIFLDQARGGNPIWPRFNEATRHDARLQEVAGVVFFLAAHLFNAVIPVEAMESTVARLTPASSFWVHQYGLKSAFLNFTNSKSSLYLHRLFVQKESDWKEIRRRRLFPVQKPAVVARPSSQGITPRLAAQCRQLMHIVRRSWFHTAAAFDYAWGLNAWRRGVKSAARPIAERADIPLEEMASASAHKPLERGIKQAVS